MNGEGSQANPFDKLADAAMAADQTGDIIFIYGGDGTSTNLDKRPTYLALVDVP